MADMILTWENGVPVVREATEDDQLPNVGPTVPQSVLPSQMRVALHRLDLLTTVNQIAALDPEAAIVWEFARDIVRNSPFITALASNPVQTFTTQEIDDIFILAASIEL